MFCMFSPWNPACGQASHEDSGLDFLSHLPWFVISLFAIPRSADSQSASLGFPFAPALFIRRATHGSKLCWVAGTAHLLRLSDHMSNGVASGKILRNPAPWFSPLVRVPGSSSPGKKTHRLPKAGGLGASGLRELSEPEKLRNHGHV